MRKKTSLLLIPLLFFLVISLYSLEANRMSGTFHLYLNQSQSLGVQLLNYENVSLTMNLGEINSTTSTVSNELNRGYLGFNSSMPGNFTVDFSEGLTVSFNGGTLRTGALVGYGALSNNVLRWNVAIYDPFEHYFFPVIGLIGFIMTAASGFYTAQTIRNRDEDVMKYSYGIVLLILGIVFIMVWFYG